MVKRKCDNNFISYYRFSPGTGHYTQMVWARTHKIGCGYSSYRGAGFIKKFIVCNYGDAGNLLNAPMYQVGSPCSNCPVNTTNQYTNGAILSKLAPAVLLKRHKFSFLFNELFNKVIRLRAEHCALVLKKHRWWMARTGQEKGKGCL